MPSKPHPKSKGRFINVIFSNGSVHVLHLPPDVDLSHQPYPQSMSSPFIWYLLLTRAGKVVGIIPRVSEFWELGSVNISPVRLLPDIEDVPFPKAGK
jgi:hypothetical protein